MSQQCKMLFDEQLFPFCDKPTCIWTKALAIKDDEVDLNILILDGHDDDLPPAATPPLNLPQPPCPCMPECAIYPLSPSKRPSKAAPECHLPIGIPAVPLAPVHYFGCKHHVPHWPGNVYSDDHYSVNQLKDIKRDKASTPSRSRILRSFSDTAPTNISIPDMTATNLSKDKIKHITREGGGVLNTYLLSKVIQLDSTTMDSSKKLIHKWIYRDIYKLSVDETAKWKAACCK